MKKAIPIIALLLASFCLASCAAAPETAEASPVPTVAAEDLPTPTVAAEEERPGDYTISGVLSDTIAWLESARGLERVGAYSFEEDAWFRKEIEAYTAVELSDGTIIGHFSFVEEQKLRYDWYDVFGEGKDYAELFFEEASKGEGLYLDIGVSGGFFIIGENAEDYVGYYMKATEGESAEN